MLSLPISYQLVIVININIDINYQNRLLSISIQYQLSEHPLINFNININFAIFAYQYFLINALSSSAGNPISLYYILQPLTVFGAIGVHLVSVTRLVVPDTDIVQGHPQGHSMEEQSV